MSEDARQANYFDVLVAIEAYRRTGDTGALRECLESGRRLTPALRMLIGDALIARLRGEAGRGRGQPTEPWAGADNAVLCRAIGRAYRTALVVAQRRRPRERAVSSNEAHAAGIVARSELGRRLALTPSGVLRARTRARQLFPGDWQGTPDEF